MSIINDILLRHHNARKEIIMWVIIKKGKYVAIGGRKNSYTNSINWAQIFKTEEDAIRAKCDDETVKEITNKGK
jgi:hypothetical protein